MVEAYKVAKKMDYRSKIKPGQKSLTSNIRTHFPRRVELCFPFR